MSSAMRPAAVAVASLSTKWRPRTLSVCCSTSQKGDHNPKTDLHAFNIPAFALVHPVPPREERWQLKEEADKVNLWFEVPGQSKDDLTVEIDEDVLVIKKNTVHAVGGASDKEAAQGREVIYARLLLPAGYNREGVKAELTSGVLMVSVAKIKEQARRKIPVVIQAK